MAALKEDKALIPAIVSAHYEDREKGGEGWDGIRRSKDVAHAWYWQPTVKVAKLDGCRALLDIQGHESIFSGELIEFGQPALWIYDCRRCSAEGSDEPWNAKDYGRSMKLLQGWMSEIPRWNDKVLPLLALPEGTIARRSIWNFSAQSSEVGGAH